MLTGVAMYNRCESAFFLCCPSLDPCFLWKWCFYLPGDGASYSLLSLAAKCFQKIIQKSWLEGYQRASWTVAASWWK